MSKFELNDQELESISAGVLEQFLPEEMLNSHVGKFLLGRLSPEEDEPVRTPIPPHSNVPSAISDEDFQALVEVMAANGASAKTINTLYFLCGKQ